MLGAGFFHEGDLPAPRRAAEDAHTRAIGRLAGDYNLRMLAPVRACCGDPLDAIIVLLLLRTGEAEDDPIGPAQIARALFASPETVRRRLGRLVEAGLCQRVKRGYLVPTEVVRDVLLPKMSGPSELNLRRLFRQIAAVSVGIEHDRGIHAGGHLAGMSPQRLDD